MQRHVPRGVQDLVDQRIRQWQLERSKQPAEAAHPAQPHVVTLSREVGAGGAALAQMLATELGFDLWDRNIVHEIAEKSGTRESLLATLDEHARGLLAQLRDNLSGSGAEPAAYAMRLGEVVQTIGHHGDAVVVGRGGQFLLSSENALAVRLVAPLEARAARFAEREGIDLVEARAQVQAREKDRLAFFQQHFGEDPRDPIHYDLVINTERVSLQQAKETIVAAFRAKFGV